MAFKFDEEAGPAKVQLRAGRLRVARGEEAENEVGVNLELDTETGVLEGKILFHKVPIGIKNKADLAKAIEKFINDTLDAKL